ncbi:MAG: PASTA domain-containing protein [Pyrinomonadaceae bacterium]|nr:PASTA domain-containing protein [Pyrinomonadaceae bacterium]
MIAPKRTFLGLLGKFVIVICVAVAFLFGLLGTVYLSFRSPEVQVPNLVGRARAEGESELQKIGLNMRKRAERPSADAKPDTIIDQSPRAGENIKVGQTVAVIVSRPPKEGEMTESAAVAPSPENRNASGRANAVNSNINNRNEADRSRNSANRNSNTRNANNRNANVRNANGNNTNNSNNSNSANRNQNANNRNANVRNLNTNVNRNSNTNRNVNNANANRRPPLITTPPFNPNANRRP